MPTNQSLAVLRVLMFVAVMASALRADGPTPPPGASQTPLALLPANPHYFLFRGKPTLIVSSGEHYGSVLNLDFDYLRYLDELQACGLNHTRLWTGTYRELPGSFDIHDNTLAPKPARAICPWPRTNTPGASDGQNKYDLTEFNPAFFERLTDFIAQASKRGIIVEVNLFCPNYDDTLWSISPMKAANNTNGIGDCPRDDVYTLKHPDLLDVQKKTARKIVESLAQFDNIYFEVCNEPYFGGVTREWQDKIAAEIVDAEKKLPHKHLISMNIANGSKKIEGANPAVSIFNFHYCAPPDTVGINYALNKVIGENETGFKGSKDVTYRTEGWDFVLAGGGLYDNLDYSFTVSHPDGSAIDYKAPGGGSHALREQLGAMRKFIEGFDFAAMSPDAAVIKGGPTTGTTARALSQPGRQYAVYVKGGTHIDLQLDLPKGEYAAEWINPRTGQFTKREVVTGSGVAISLASPTYAEDIALAVRVSSARAKVDAIPVILDTDISSDVDDCGALAILNALADRGEANILACVIDDHDADKASVAAVNAINTYYGRGNVPIGAYQGDHGKPSKSPYTAKLRDEFPNSAPADDKAPPALTVYRKALADAPDGSVVIISVGFLMNLSDLIDSKPDDISPLSGRDLVSKKVKKLAVMGGQFPNPQKFEEWNFTANGVGSDTKHVVENWPTPILFDGFSIGQGISTGPALQVTPTTNPVRRAYELYDNALKNGRSSWDPTTVLAAIGDPEKYWNVMGDGLCTISEKGVSAWTETPHHGHSYLAPKADNKEIAKALDALMTAPPVKKP